MLHREICIIFVLLEFFNLRSMGAFVDTNEVWFDLINNESSCCINDPCVKKSMLITFLTKNFDQAGSYDNPVTLIVDKLVTPALLQKFFDHAPTNYKDASITLSDKFIFLSLALYLQIPSAQNILEHAIISSYKKLEVAQALQETDSIHALDLALPPSFIATMLSKKIIKVFAEKYPPEALKNCTYIPPALEFYQDYKFVAIRELIAKFYTKECLKQLINCTGFKMAWSQTTPVRLVKRSLDYPGSFIYFCLAIPQPLEFEHTVSSSINHLIINNTGTKIVSCSYDNLLVVWDEDTQYGIWLKTVLDNTTFYTIVQLSADQSLLLAVSTSQSESLIKVWQNTTNQLLATHTLSIPGICSVETLQDNKQLLLRDHRGVFYIFDTQEQGIINSWPAKPLDFSCCSQSSLTADANNKYYALWYPLKLYNNYHQALIDLSQQFCYLNASLQYASFDENNDLILITKDGTKKFLFALSSLDKIVQQLPDLNLVQAVAILLQCSGKKIESNDRLLIEAIINKLPCDIKNLVSISYKRM